MAIVFTEEQAGNYLRQQSNYKSAIDSIQKQFDTQFQSGLTDLGKSYGREGYTLGKDFTQSMSQAFDAAKQQRSSFLSQSSSIGSGQRQAMAIDLEQATMNAYDSYIQNYMLNKQNLEQNLRSGVASLESTKAEGVQKAQATLEKDIGTEAANYAALANAPMEYLQYLWETDPTQFDTNDALSRYTYFDENGQRQLIDSAMLGSDFYQQRGDGYILTDAGKEFYNTMLYGMPTNTFYNYLKSEKSDLYNWAIASNTYGDAEHVNAQGYSSNFDSVFGGILGADAVKAESYDTTQNKYRNKTYSGGDVESYENSLYGNVEQVKSSKGVTVLSLEGLTFKTNPGNDPMIGLEWDDVVDGEAENFQGYYTDKNGKKHIYDFKVLKDEADSATFADISNAFGKIENQRLYDYGGEMYMGVVDKDGVTHLRKVKTYSDTPSNDTGKINYDERGYSAYK